MDKRIALNPAQIELIAATTIRLFKKKVCGAVDDIIVHTLHDLFLAREDNNIWGEPKSLTAKSVVDYIHEAFLLLIEAKRIKAGDNAELYAFNIQQIAARAINVLNKKKALMVPHNRLKQYFQEQSWDISDKEETLSQTLEKDIGLFYDEEDISLREILFEQIDAQLKNMGELRRRLADIDEYYDIWTDDETEDETNDSHELAISWNVSEWEHLGWSSDSIAPDNMLNFEEKIPLSLAEESLWILLPKDITSQTHLFPEIFQWSIPGEEYQKEGITVEDYPDIHMSFLREVLKRKKIIFVYAQHNLDGKKKAWIRWKKYTDNLLELKKETKTLQKIIDTKKSDDKKEWQTLLRRWKNEEEYLLGERTKIFRERNELLATFYQTNEEEKWVYSARIDGLTKRLVIIGQKINSLFAWDEEDSPEQNGEDGIIPAWSTSSQLLENIIFDPDFYKKELTDIDGGPSHEECNLIKSLQLEEFFHTEEPLICGMDIEIDSNEKDTEIRRMLIFEYILQTTIARKQYVHFRSVNSPIFNQQEHEELILWLRDQIESLQDALNIVKRRIKWATNTEDKWSELITELHELKTKRLHLLRYFFHATDTSIRIGTWQALLWLIHALHERQKELDQTGITVIGDIKAKSAPYSHPEARLIKYIPKNVYNKEQGIFWPNVDYEPSPEDPYRKVKNDIKRVKQNRAYERTLLLYFYGHKRLREIESLLSQGADASLTIEAGEIQQHLENLKDIIHEHIQIVESGFGYDMNKGFPCWPLYDESITLLGEIDGITTYANPDEESSERELYEELQYIIREFWNTLLSLKKSKKWELVQKIQNNYGNRTKLLALKVRSIAAEKSNTEYLWVFESLLGTIADVQQRLFGNIYSRDPGYQ